MLILKRYFYEKYARKKGADKSTPPVLHYLLLDSSLSTLTLKPSPLRTLQNSRMIAAPINMPHFWVHKNFRISPKVPAGMLGTTKVPTKTPTMNHVIRDLIIFLIILLPPIVFYFCLMLESCNHNGYHILLYHIIILKSNYVTKHKRLLNMSSLKFIILIHHLLNLEFCFHPKLYIF